MRYILNRPDVERQWLFERCDEVQAAPNGHLDLWAREHYKSTIITFAKSIQDILRSHGEDRLEQRECTIGIFSHTRPNAKGFLRQIKQEFEGNRVLQELFPDILYENPSKQSSKWSEDEGIAVKRKGNPKEQTVEAWGLVDGQPTGKHFSLLVYDDIVTRESVTTPDMIRKTTEALELSYNLGTDGGKRRFIGTRYHFNDSYRELISRGTAKPRVYAATSDGTVDGEPVLLSKEALQTKRRDMGSYTFASQMLQNPTADDAQGFKEEWMRYYDSLELRGLNIYICVDPANEKKKTSDYSVFFALGLGQDNKIRVVDIVRDRLNLTERTRLLFNWHRKYKPVRDGVRYERYGMQTDIGHIKDCMQQENYDFEIVEVGGATSKPDRIRRLLPLFEQHRIIFPRSLHYTGYDGRTRDLVQDFIHEEFKPFPVPLHDDMLDALARIAEPDLTLTWPKQVVEQELMPKHLGYGINFFGGSNTGNSWMGI